jgi:hypothetical protein
MLHSVVKNVNVRLEKTKQGGAHLEGIQLGLGYASHDGHICNCQCRAHNPRAKVKTLEPALRRGPGVDEEKPEAKL